MDAWLALAMIVALAFLMISTIRYVSFKAMAFGGKGSYRNLIFITLVMVAVVIHPQGVLVLMAYTYLISGVIGLLTSRFKRGQGIVDQSLKSTSEDSFSPKTLMCICTRTKDLKNSPRLLPRII